MEFLAFLYTVLLVAICLMMALLLYRSAKPAANRDDAERKEWLRQQLEAQNRQMDAKLAEMAQQNLAAMGHISETLQASVQSMSTALAAGQGTQQQTMEQRLQGLEASNARKLEEMRRTLAEGMTALQAQNAQKLDEIRHTVDEQLQDALQKRVTESFKAVNDQLEQVYKGLGEMQNLAADVGGLKQVLSGVKTRGILGEIQLGAIPRNSTTPTWPPVRAAPSGWSTPSGCPARTAARCGCPSTPSSPATPMPIYRMRRHPATRRPWRTPATHWNWCCGPRPRTSGKNMWSRPTPRRSASCFYRLRACMPRW